MDYLSHNIAINLKRIRKAKAMSLDVVAEQTGVSKSMLATIEKGDANPSIGVLGKIMSGLRVDLQDLTQVPQGDVYLVDVENGQKTGFFLDQKYNRLAIQRLCPGKRVLDCFTHTGSFALNAAVSGAKEVIGVDASELAVAQARENAELNGVSGTTTFQCADVFDLLPELEAKGEQFDVVILDPPAFTKSRSSIKNAVKGYREINLRGMKLVRDGGFLATCSCSHFMDYELFTKTIGQAARNAHKRLRQVEYRTQAADHPILWAADESYYLKFFIFQVVDER